MAHLELPEFLKLLFLILASAKLAGYLAQKLGQPAVLGELVAGVVIGKTALGFVDPSREVFHLMSELGVLILLFSIGLETDLKALVKAGPSSLTVAIAGVVLPFAAGYGVCRLMGLPSLVAIVAGAALTATSVGITARVLSDLGQLKSRESQVILGAAIFDDVLGLIILSVVDRLADGREVSALGVLKIAGAAFGFLAAVILVGQWIVPPLLKMARKVRLPGTQTILALLLAFGLAWLADRLGSAVILGAFAAGLLVVNTPGHHEIEEGVTQLGHFFVPIFFVVVGASVDVRVLNPMVPANRWTLTVAAVLIAVAVVTKFAAGFAPFWFQGKKSVVGAGMIPRGEVGLIFAQKGLNARVFDPGMFACVTLVVMATTFLAPPLLKALLPRGVGGPSEDCEGIENLTTEA